MMSLPLPLLLLLLAVVLRIRRNANVSPLLATSLLCFVALWYVVPIAALYLFPDLVNPPIAGLDSSTVANVASLETVILLVTCLFLLHPRPYFRFIPESQPAQQSLSAGLVLTVLLAGLGLLVASSLAVPELVGANYLERNAFATTAQGSPVYNVLGSLETLTSFAASFGYACLFTRWPDRWMRRLIQWLVGLSIAVATAAGLLSGARIAILTPLVLLVLHYQVHGGRSGRRALQILLAGVLTLTVGGTAALVVGQSRGAGPLSAREVVEQALEPTNVDDSNGEAAAFLRELVTKSNMHLPGALLLERDGVGVAGWQPYVGALVAVVPRFVLPSKPVPGSANGDYSGHPTRVAAALLGMDPAIGNVQVSPAAISLWL